MADKSGAQLRFDVNRLPFLEGARQYAGEWLFPGGACRNQPCYERHVEFAPDVPDELRNQIATGALYASRDTCRVLLERLDHGLDIVLHHVNVRRRRPFRIGDRVRVQLRHYLNTGFLR